MKKTMTLLAILASTLSFAGETLVTCSRKHMDNPAYDHGVEINRCISYYKRTSTFKNCLLAARFIDNKTMSFDYQRAAVKCLNIKRISYSYQCDSLNKESDSNDEYNDYYIEDYHYTLQSKEAGF